MAMIAECPVGNMPDQVIESDSCPISCPESAARESGKRGGPGGLKTLYGCYPPSSLEMDYGSSVRNDIAQQVVNPRVGFNEQEKYDKSFKAGRKEITGRANAKTMNRSRHTSRGTQA